MPTAVKRNAYESPLRAAQAQATRRTIVTAAAELFVERGYGATTVDAIAERAGVSRKTVFTSVGGKSEALKLAIDWAIVGDDQPVPVMERPVVRDAEAEPDARKILAAWAGFGAGVSKRIHALYAVVESASGVEPDLRELLERGTAQRRFGMGELAKTVGSRGALRKDVSVDEAADILWMLGDPRHYQWFVVRQHWSDERFEQWLIDTAVALLVDPSYRPRKPRTAGARAKRAR